MFVSYQPHCADFLIIGFDDVAPPSFNETIKRAADLLFADGDGRLALNLMGSLNTLINGVPVVVILGQGVN